MQCKNFLCEEFAPVGFTVKHFRLICPSRASTETSNFTSRFFPFACREAPASFEMCPEATTRRRSATWPVGAPPFPSVTRTASDQVLILNASSPSCTTAKVTITAQRRRRRLQGTKCADNSLNGFEKPIGIFASTIRRCNSPFICGTRRSAGRE